MNRSALVAASFATGGAGFLHLWHAFDAQTDGEAAFFAIVGAAQLLVAGAGLAQRAAAWTLCVFLNATVLSIWAVVHLPNLVAGSGALTPMELAVLGLQAAAVLIVIGELAHRHPRTPVEADGPPIDESRRRLIAAGTISVAGAIVGGAFGRIAAAAGHPGVSDSPRVGAHAGIDTGHSATHGGMTTGEVDHARNGFDPSVILDDWDTGDVSVLATGQTLREYLIVAEDKTIEVAPGVFFESWTYNGRVPGPTIRCQEGDRVRIRFTNAGSHPHTIHFHGIHSAAMDGVPGQGPGLIAPGASTIYEFDAFPFGCHLYHCHTPPLARHIHKGLYGAFIIDPDPARHLDQQGVAVRRTLDGARAAGIREMVMVMNGFDTNFDGENEVYAANTVAFHYVNHPIRVGTDDDIRIYLVNITEFDPINSLHLHANFFDYYDHGTTLDPTHRTIDTVMQCQAQRGILEFNFRGYEPGKYMIHAHQSEFVELGWMGFFEVVSGRAT